VWRLRVNSDVIQYLPDIGTVRDERDQAHLAATQWTQQRELLIS
jgi:hypothetical protein